MSSEVVVDIDAVGLCHTDWAIARGVFPVPFPVVLGHEGTGIIREVGALVTELVVGDRVVLTGPRCRRCRFCMAGRPAYCENADALSFSCCRSDGSSSLSTADGEPVGSHYFGQSSFASKVVSPADACVVIDRDVPAAVAAPLGCGVVTGWGAITRSLKVRSEDTVVVVGAGTVGLSAVCAARAVGATMIVVVEPVPERRALARSLGATDAVTPGEAPELRAQSGGFDVVVSTFGSPDAVATSIALAGRCGRIGIIGGAQKGSAQLDVNDVLFSGKEIRGIRMGDQIASQTIPELVRQWRAGRLPIEQLTTEYPLAQINEAIDDASAGRVVKAVLRP